MRAVHPRSTVLNPFEIKVRKRGHTFEPQVHTLILRSKQHYVHRIMCICINLSVTLSCCASHLCTFTPYGV